MADAYESLVSLVKDAAPSDVKAVLIALCSNAAETATEAETLLRKMQEARREPAIACTVHVGVKRKAEHELAICADCKEPFCPEDNERKECYWHEGIYMLTPRLFQVKIPALTLQLGEMETDDAEWPDHDEDIHGIIDSEESRKEYPENFTWTCCGRRGDEQGCARSRHSLSRKEYGGYSADEGDSEESDEEEEEESEA